MSRNQKIRTFLALSICALMVVPFTNCGQYADPANADLYNQSIEDCDDDCINPNVENLSIKVNLDGGNTYSVTSGMVDWNLGGDCNEGGYPTNLIRWELLLNGVVVRHSGMYGMNARAPSSNSNSRCVNGRFALYINLGPIAEDPVNREALATGGGPTSRTSYEMTVEIFGQRVVNDPQLIRNTVKGKTRLTLNAI